ncbi:MAG: hypothetical protein O9327_18285 [Polaromonas sp.]|nr:hypothetical protein [Polaromonas sp.]
MNIVHKIASAASSAKAAIAVASLTAYSQIALADSFSSPQNNGVTLGKVSKNVANSLVDGVSAVEAFLYLAGVVFIALFVFALVKWKKSDGRDANGGLIAIYLVAAVGCMAAPTLMGGGIATLFGNTNVKTIQAPQPTFN